MAAIGLILSNENMGYGGTDDVIGGYKAKLEEINQQKDLDLKLTKQNQLILKALLALHTAQSVQDGLSKMNSVFSQDHETKRNYATRVIAGNTQLLRFNSFGPLATIAKSNRIFALHYLTHNLNPYGNGKKRTSPALRKAAIDAVYIYQKLEVDGTAQISADCIDVAEYYADWETGKSTLDAQRIFLVKNVGDNLLFREEGSDIITNDLDVKYMSLSQRRINEYERLHFFELQVDMSSIYFYPTTCVFLFNYVTLM